MAGFMNRKSFIVSNLIVIFFLGSCNGVEKATSYPEQSTSTLPLLLTQTPTIQALCQTIPTAPTPGPDEKSIFPAIDKADHVRGPVGANVTFVEYGDFQCPGCANLAPVLLQLEEKFSKDLQVVFRQLPLYDIHDKALLAAQAAEAAGDFGKFWEMHDLLYGQFELWKSMTPELFSSWVVEQASSIGLDKAIFAEKLTSQTITSRVEKDLELGLGIGLRTTPFLLINGQMYNGPRDYSSLDQIVRLILLGKSQFNSCPKLSIDPLKQYIAFIHTEKGDITIQLFPDKAPFAVNSFIFLASKGWYDNNTFYKVIPNSIVQTGDPSGTGLGGPGYLFQIETDQSINFDSPGVVALANSGMDTNGSQFFITLTPQPDLNGMYTIIGQVISGMDVLNKLTPRNPENGITSPNGDLLISITISEK